MRPVLMLLAAAICIVASAQDANVAPTARITTEPAVEVDRVLHILDGRVNTGFAFDVGTSGEGTASFDLGAPRQVSGLRGGLAR